MYCEMIQLEDEAAAIRNSKKFSGCKTQLSSHGADRYSIQVFRGSDLVADFDFNDRELMTPGSYNYDL